MLMSWLSGLVLVFIVLPVAAGLVLGMGARLFPSEWRGLVGVIGFLGVLTWAGYRPPAPALTIEAQAQAYLKEAQDNGLSYKEWLSSCSNGGLTGAPVWSAFVYDAFDSLRARAPMVSLKNLGDHMYLLTELGRGCDKPRSP